MRRSTLKLGRGVQRERDLGACLAVRDATITRYSDRLLGITLLEGVVATSVAIVALVGFGGAMDALTRGLLSTENLELAVAEATKARVELTEQLRDVDPLAVDEAGAPLVSVVSVAGSPARLEVRRVTGYAVTAAGLQAVITPIEAYYVDTDDRLVREATDGTVDVVSLRVRSIAFQRMSNGLLVVDVVHYADQSDPTEDSSTSFAVYPRNTGKL